jgi:aryl-alcohol dehydrogenase-like predicted oxidoreductase
MPDLVTLPGTDLQVSRLCLGGNRLGSALDQNASFELLDAFVEQGGRFVDTAHVYADWVPGIERSCSEKTIGRWLAARGCSADVVVATKIGHPRLDEPGPRRLDPASLRIDVEESISFLGVSALDLVYLHRDDPDRPVEDILATIESLRREGLLRSYGASNWTPSRLMEAHSACRRNGWAGFSANQAEWSLAQRNPGSAAGDLVSMDAAMIALHQRTGLAAVPYSAQAKGYFDKLNRGALDEDTALAYDSASNRAVAGRLVDMARRLQATPTQVALAVLIRTPFPTIAVVGCRTQQQVASSFRSLALELSHDEVAEFLPVVLDA